MISRDNIDGDGVGAFRERVPSASPLPNVQESLAALQRCTESCLRCFSVLAGRERPDAEGGSSCMQCSEICMLTMTLLSQESPLSLHAGDLCIRACEWCAEQCSAQADAECQDAAEACRACVEALQQSRPVTATSTLDSREAFGG